MKQYLTVPEFAERVGRTGPAVRTWIENGWLKAQWQPSRTGRKANVRISLNEAKRMERLLRIGLPPSAASLEGFKVFANQ